VIRGFILILIATIFPLGGISQPDRSDYRLVELKRQLEQLREALNIPGMSAAVVQNDRIIWSQGFGWADLAHEIPAGPQTTYRIASCGQPVTAFLIMRLVENGQLSLDARAEDYNIYLSRTGLITIRDILSHTSSGRPGTHFRYDEIRFGMLDSVFRMVRGYSFDEELYHDFIQPLGLQLTAPTNNDPEFPVDSADPRYVAAFRHLTKYYDYDTDEFPQICLYPRGFGASGGWVTSVKDYATFLIAQDSLLSQNSKKMLYSPVTLTHGDIIPFGLGWFIQEIQGHRIAWHFGWNPPGVSSLVIQDLSAGYKFVLFANSDRLSRPFWLQSGDLMRSPAALVFLRTLIFNPPPTALFAEPEQKASQRIAYITGTQQPLDGLERIILWFVFIILLTPLIFWPAGYFLRRKSGQQFGALFTTSRYIAGLAALLALLTNIMFTVQPELLYWDTFPGWLAGVPLYQNLFLLFPSVIAGLLIIALLFGIGILSGKKGTPTFRSHYLLVTLAILIYLAFLINWHLVWVIP